MPLFKSNRSRNEVFGPILSTLDTSAMTHVADAYPMPSKALGRPAVSDGLYDGYKDADVLDGDLYSRYDVKRGLRNADARRAVAEGELLALDEHIALQRNRLAALLGAGPDRGLSITAPTLRIYP